MPNIIKLLAIVIPASVLMSLRADTDIKMYEIQALKSDPVGCFAGFDLYPQALPEFFIVFGADYAGPIVQRQRELATSIKPIVRSLVTEMVTLYPHINLYSDATQKEFDSGRLARIWFSLKVGQAGGKEALILCIQALGKMRTMSDDRSTYVVTVFEDHVPITAVSELEEKGRELARRLHEKFVASRAARAE